MEGVFNIRLIKDFAFRRFKDITCSVSMLTMMADGFNPLVSQVKTILEKLAKSEPNISIINIDSIRSDFHLKSSGVHLNLKGEAALAGNYIQ